MTQPEVSGAQGISIRVPASSANLGPGYDSFGLALARYDEVTVRRAATLHVSVEGVGADVVPRTREHLVVRSMYRALARLGVDAVGLDLQVDLHCRNRIPHGGGQGSSAAAIVAGVLAARELAVDVGADRPSDADVLDLAARIEGHPDNVAAALLGGFTIAWREDAGTARAVRAAVHPSIRAVLFTAGRAVPTSAARALLPPTVPHGDAAANAAAAGLLVHAITADPGLLLEATEDRLHQRFRAEAMPDSMVLIDDLRAGGVAAVLSGAGPSVLALVAGNLAVEDWARPGFTAVALDIDRDGALVRGPVPSAP